VSVSDAESHIMALLWARAPQGADELTQALAGQQDWQPGTIKALLNRLLRKGAIAATRDGRRFLYRPLLSRDEYLTRSSEALLDRLFDGRLAPLVAHFARHQRLDRRDLAELKRLIEEMDDGDA
jgi:predicted transcriptional regulator